MMLGKNIAYDFDAQPFRLLAKARSHLPFQGRYNRLDLKLQFAITTNSICSLKGSWQNHAVILTEGCACDKLGLSIKRAGIAAGDD